MAITDRLGPNPRHVDRVAIKKADLITLRDAHIKSQGYSLHHKDIKNPDSDAILKAARMMEQGPQGLPSSDESAWELASKLAGIKLKHSRH